jgi:hypothetical protein
LSEINNDVISKYKSEYCIAKIPNHGMVEIEGKIFHKGNSLERFKAYTFDSLRAAKAMLPDDLEAFIIEFEGGDRLCERMWFSNEQKEKGITTRLDLWKACYGGYAVSVYKK